MGQGPTHSDTRPGLSIQTFEDCVAMMGSRSTMGHTVIFIKSSVFLSNQIPVGVCVQMTRRPSFQLLPGEMLVRLLFFAGHFK